MLLVMTISLNAFDVYTEISGLSSFYNQDGELVGSSVEIFKELQKIVGNTDEIKVVPWARGYRYITRKDNVILFAMTRTSEREKLFKWVGPVVKLKWVMYGRKNFIDNIENLNDSRGLYRIGTVRDDVREQYLKKKGFSNLEPARDNITNIKKLQKKRIDLMISSDIGFSKTVKEAGCKASEFKEVFTFKEVYLYVAFSKNVADKTIAIWQSALEELKESGTFKTIYEKYYPGIEVP